MFSAVLLIILLFIASQPILYWFAKKYDFFDLKLLNKIFVYHFALGIVYYIYLLTNGGDAVGYYKVAAYYNEIPFYNTGTQFIILVCYPLTSIGFSLEAVMVIFTWFGYWGFVFFYLFMKENCPKPVYWKNIDLMTIFLFLPNMHFWNTCIGKGPLIFLGLAWLAYAMNNPIKRLVPLVLGLLIIYNVRPHVFMFMLVGIAFGYMTGKEKIPLFQKIALLAVAIVLLLTLQDNVLEAINMSEGNYEEAMASKAERLSQSGSGVDMNNYPLPLKLFTFWFRPLFIDAGNVMGLIVSFENLFLLWLTASLFNKQFIRFLIQSPAIVKMSLAIFIASSVAMSFVMSNLGIIIRQKTMVMYFLLFVILAFLYQKVYDTQPIMTNTITKESP